MNSLSIDIETFSSADLNRTGVYHYVLEPDFDILLFGYAVDGGVVNVIDLASGESIPGEIIDAITDSTVIKTAFNANFERICLSRWLTLHGYPLHNEHYSVPEDYVRDYLDPSSWRCTMVWSAYLGLPLSLAGVGTVLGLEKQKLEEGKELIRYFCIPCKPTESNGGRTRNLPCHAPEKWELFKRYNKRDVETEMEIQQRLSNYPVPDFVWGEYHLDQEINDRGIAVDITLVNSAIAMDAQSNAELTEKMRELTQLVNPGSVMQMKRWLAENGMEVDSLGKKEVAALLKDAPAPLRDVLTLRQQLAKSSVKKYTAMRDCVCADGRARGMFQFYGANRTGRFCLTGDHEVLTPNGWVRLDQWDGGILACWSASTQYVSFQEAKKVSFDYSGPMYTYADTRIDQCSTPDHKMFAKKRYDSDWQDMTVEEMSKLRPSIPLTGIKQYRNTVNTLWLRILIMIQADGYYKDDGSISLNFKKQRKIERCKMLLRQAGIAYQIGTYEKEHVTRFTIPSRCVPLWLKQFRTKTFGYWLFDESPDVFFDELPNWDGYRCGPNSIQYATCYKQNADIVQALAHMSGRTAIMKTKVPSNPNWKTAYILDIWLYPGNCHEIKAKPVVTDFNGKVYCAVTSTGYFLVRRNGKVWVTGNSGRLVQLQNLPQNHLNDLDNARELVRDGDYEAIQQLYGDVPDTLSQLIRTAFIAPEGKQFYVADFSAIEARVIAWIAHEDWRAEVFKNGGDIYCASASQMFKVPVEKHGINGHLRQKGKIAELALGYGGSVGALKAMGAIEMGLQEEELYPLVKAWRESNPNIVKLWWDVDAAAMEAVNDKTTVTTHGLTFTCKSGMLFITLPSGRNLSYVKPMIGTNQFGAPSITYLGVGGTKRWERLETYGPKLVENIVQGFSRDVLCHAMNTLRYCFICGHVHDEVIIEADPKVSLEAICEQMGRTPPWAEGLILRADGYTTPYYKKD